MSINVTVTGNPVSIRRGKMITASLLPYAEDTGFKKRRKLRLEQVREQSKEIAENVRNKVRNEKSKQLSKNEKKGAEHFKEYQHKKLLELQNQYDESIKDIGLGHIQAAVENVQESELLDRRLLNEENERLKEREQVKKNETIKKGAAVNQPKQTYVAKAAVPKMPTKKQKIANKDIIVDLQLDESENEFGTERNVNIAETAVSEYTNKQNRQSSMTADSETEKENSPINLIINNTERNSEIPLDKRISERIKNRIISSNPPANQLIVEADVHHAQNTVSENPSTSNFQAYKPCKQQFDINNCCICCKCKQKFEHKPELVNIPSKPSISVQTEMNQDSRKKVFNKVYSYDHNNRFQSGFVADNSNIKEINTDSIRACHDVESEVNLEKVALERKRVAESKGMIALKKKKLQKEYEELLQKLPVLHRQEKMAAVDPVKDKLHMDDFRLAEHAGKKQKLLESAYEKLIPSAITIEPKNADNASKNNIEIKTKKVENDLTKQSTTDLRAMLKKLNQQKELLVQENETLPETSNLLTLLAGLDKVKKKPVHVSKSQSTSEKQAKPKKLKAQRDVLILQNTSTQTSPLLKNVEKEVGGTNLKDAHKRECRCDNPICEVLIKIQENEKPKVVVKKSKNVDDVEIGLTEVDNVIAEGKEGAKPKKRFENVNVECKRHEGREMTKPTKPKKRYAEEISTTVDKPKGLLNENYVNSNTSYYSPPDYAHQNKLASILQNKPQQGNINKEQKRNVKPIDNNLMQYIKRLLTMSKLSVENLGVSSASEVSTPSSSVMQTPSNTGAVGNVQKAMDLIKNINTYSDNIGKRFNDVPDKKDYSSFETSNNTSYKPVLTDTSSSYDKKMYDSNDLAKNIKDIAEKCEKKINDLAKKIETLRSEPLAVFSPISVESDKNNVTSYLNLPSANLQDSALSPEQIELTKKLLQVNVNDLQKTAVDTDSVLRNRLENVLKSGSIKDEFEKDVVDRYVRLLKNDETVKNDGEKLEESFSPLLDIPKIPKFPRQPAPGHLENVVVTKLNGNNRKVLELSTIPEVDATKKTNDAALLEPNKAESKAESKADSPAFENIPSSDITNTSSTFISLVPSSSSNSGSKTKSKNGLIRSPKQDRHAMVSSVTPESIKEQTNRKNCKKPNADEQKKNCSSPQPGPSKQNNKHSIEEKLLQTLRSISTDSSNDKSDDVESMLRSLGMDWAVSTLKKTQQALAIHSSTSTSSVENVKGKKTEKAQLTKSDSNFSMFFRENFQEISAIFESMNSGERRHHNSTPFENPKL